MMFVEKEFFGKLEDDSDIYLFSIKNKDYSQAQFTNYGATVVSLQVPDREGKIEHVVLGFDTLQKYVDFRNFYGATIGRWANRIANGQFTLNGKIYHLTVNEGKNHLHGGIRGFDRVVWDWEIVESEIPSIRFSYLSKDGEEDFPGNLNVSVTYSFTEDHNLIIGYEMSTDKPTVKNITNHSYFNLSGNLNEDILNHSIKINADRFLPIDKNLIPTGELRSVAGSPMDFLRHAKIGERIDEENSQLKLGLGYDHCYVLNKNENELGFAAEVYESHSGRVMSVLTTEPAIQFYTGNFMDGSQTGREGVPYQYRHAFCLETQHFPDSPNKLHFPSSRLDPGEKYQSKTVYKFSTK